MTVFEKRLPRILAIERHCDFAGIEFGQHYAAPALHSEARNSTLKAPQLYAVLLTLASAVPVPAIAATEKQDAKAVHWSYTEHGGADHWSELDSDFATCKLGQEQSPIDIRDAAPASLPPLAFHYGQGKALVVNNGHTIQVNVAPGNSVTLATGKYQLLQFHFHTPSEETVAGKAYPLVAHLVHGDGSGRLAVVAVLFKEGNTHPTLGKVFAAMPAKAEEKKELEDLLNPADLLPAEQGYSAYMGSLTTPPCSEGVLWQVLRQPLELAAEQLAAFRKLYPMNARSAQPLNGRILRQSQ